MSSENVVNILDYQITTLNRNCFIEQIVLWIKSGEKGKYFVCANPHSLEIAEKDTLFKDAIKNADIIIPDGTGIVLASKILGGKIKERITGSCVFRELSSKLNCNGGGRYFFLGSTEENLALLKDKVKKDFPNIQVVGTYSPPYKQEFSDDDNRKMIDAINSTRADVLWVGMTAPKQEKWVYQNKDRLDVKLIGPVGAVFDFYIGKVQRSHPWFLKQGFEWLPRLVQEPKRLWERMLISAPKFMIRVLMQRLRSANYCRLLKKT